MRRVRWLELSAGERRELMLRPALRNPAPRESVRELVESVRSGGDSAVRALTEQFDGVRLDGLRASRAEMAKAQVQVEPARRQALERAWRNLTTFHALQTPAAVDVETEPGVRCRRVHRPLQRVGLYAPGGTAPLASTVLMLGVPSQLAGCPLRLLCTPPRADGSIDPHILVAASLAGIEAEAIFKIGGAQAIAAMAYGTESVPKVDKIFGPGNAWVTAAKRWVSEDPFGAAIDMTAGPSEVLVLADASANAAFVAADLLSQAEHDVQSQVVLVATDDGVADAVLRELAGQLETLSRQSIARASLEGGLAIVARGIDEALEIVEAYAPEHLVLQVEGAAALVEGVNHAGSVFVGPWTPEAVGDYASGTNHTLPTYGTARVLSGLGVESFLRSMTVQELTENALAELGPTVETLADLEGLDAHRQAISIRLSRLSGRNERTPSVEGEGARAVIRALARPAVLKLTPYQSARSIVAQGSLFLDANENAFAPAGSLNRYPSPQPPALVDRLSALYAVPAGELIVARGSDEVIDGLVRAFCESGHDAVMICPPTYGMYAVCAHVQGAAVTEVPLLAEADFSVDTEAIMARWSPRHKLLFLCSPNNPTGTTIPRDTIAKLCRSLWGRGLVVLDEAYVEFTSTSDTARWDNLVVLRTLSKAYGLAGARCGVGIASPAVIELLQKVRAPYPLATPAVEAVCGALDGDGIALARASVRRLVDARVQLAEDLSTLPIVDRVFPSEANFLLVRVRDLRPALDACRSDGIIIRDRSHELGLERCVRITVGTPEDNARLVAALRGATP